MAGECQAYLSSLIIKQRRRTNIKPKDEFIRGFITNYYDIKQRSEVGDYRTLDVLIAFDVAVDKAELPEKYQQLIAELAKGYDQTEAAENLGITRMTVHRWLEDISKAISEEFFKEMQKET